LIHREQEDPDFNFVCRDSLMQTTLLSLKIHFLVVTV